MRVPNPVDARARIIELTPRGRQALRVMRSSALDLERRLQQILGRQRFGELRKTLQMLLDLESVLNLLTQRRLGDVESLGGAAEMSFLGDGHEVAK